MTPHLSARRIEALTEALLIATVEATNEHGLRIMWQADPELALRAVLAALTMLNTFDGPVTCDLSELRARLKAGNALFNMRA